MKRISIIGLLLFIFAFAGQSQKIYSVENLKQSSQEDLNTYLDKALKLKKDGKTVTIVGVATLGTHVLYGLLLGDNPSTGATVVAIFTGFAAFGWIFR